MNKEIKKLWVDALRGGEYKQGKLRLCNLSQDTYCCLGVLCDLAVKNGIIKPGIRTQDSSCGTVLQFGELLSTETLPNEVMLWADLKRSNPLLSIPEDQAFHELKSEYNSLTYEITELNDDYEYDFNTFADLIEAQL